TSPNNPTNPNVSPCGCPACRGIPLPNSSLIANASALRTVIPVANSPVANHQSQADALFGGNSGLQTLFRL
ncbi:MAG: hypothetical protein ACK47R_11585, partial [Planctomycetia bacterium]